MYMLDTNVIVLCMRHPQSNCAAKVASHIGCDVCISAITYAELEFGIYNSKWPKESREAVNMFLAGIPIIEFDIYAAVHFGQILAELTQKKKNRENQDRDKMIAGHARSRGYTLVTANIKDFTNIDDLQLENWLEPDDMSK